jgi:hypothetical protein
MSGGKRNMSEVLRDVMEELVDGEEGSIGETRGNESRVASRAHD